MGALYPCGSVLMPKPRRIYRFSASWADGSFHVFHVSTVLQRLPGRGSEAVQSKGEIPIGRVFSSLMEVEASC